MKEVSHFSHIPLYIELLFNEMVLASGTGFTILIDSGIYLVTNRHNVTGKDNFTGKCISRQLSVPNKIRIHHHKYQKIGEKTVSVEHLYDDEGNPLWYEHPILKEMVDVVAVKINMELLSDVHIFPLNENESVRFRYGVTETVSVVGFPYGLRAESFPIWVTGSLATDPLINFDDLPVMLVNCTSRSGMSGSPVIIHKSSGLAEIDGFGTKSIHEPTWEFIGVYSGRVATPEMPSCESSELGRIWKAEIVYELVNSIN